MCACVRVTLCACACMRAACCLFSRCRVCMAKPVNTILLPCGHKVSDIITVNTVCLTQHGFLPSIGSGRTVTLGAQVTTSKYENEREPVGSMRAGKSEELFTSKTKIILRCPCGAGHACPKTGDVTYKYQNVKQKRSGPKTTYITCHSSQPSIYIIGHMMAAMLVPLSTRHVHFPHEYTAKSFIKAAAYVTFLGKFLQASI